MDITINRVNKVDDIRLKIVEATVGARLRSSAIKGTNLTEYLKPKSDNILEGSKPIKDHIVKDAIPENGHIAKDSKPENSNLKDD